MLVPIPLKVFLLNFKHHFFFFFLMTTLAPSTLLRFRFETQKIWMRLGLSFHTNTLSVFNENASIWKRAFKVDQDQNA